MTTATTGNGKTWAIVCAVLALLALLAGVGIWASKRKKNAQLPIGPVNPVVPVPKKKEEEKKVVEPKPAEPDPYKASTDTPALGAYYGPKSGDNLLALIGKIGEISTGERHAYLLALTGHDRNDWVHPDANGYPGLFQHYDADPKLPPGSTWTWSTTWHSNSSAARKYPAIYFPTRKEAGLA